MKKVFASISDNHFQKFTTIKGIVGAKTSGQVVEHLVDSQYNREVSKLVAKPKKKIANT